MGKVVVMDHPLIQHKIGLMRRTETGSKDFRTLAGEVAMFECYEATRDLELQDVEIETPICKTTVKELKGKKLAVVPILRKFAERESWKKNAKALRLQTVMTRFPADSALPSPACDKRLWVLRVTGNPGKCYLPF